jgi:hypothetical protein
MKQILIQSLPIMSLLLPTLIILCLILYKVNLIIKRQKIEDRMRNRPKLSKKLFTNIYQNDIWN